ncbi:hypothetical protein HYC85_006495 [Camellia sinensis]|uniref:Uncharacterized protein n=1 Tax=Camellia sinensis TaxID=4442 RepID=A0A7J7HLN6_CAMSI|nr:hypothetical protein HYC85_006495 [Camellia sinensis]
MGFRSDDKHCHFAELSSSNYHFVKLNPSLVDVWLCLGNCIWKKGDLPSAKKNYFTLALSKGPNKKVLCQLYMLERTMAQGKDLRNPDSLPKAMCPSSPKLPRLGNLGTIGEGHFVSNPARSIKDRPLLIMISRSRRITGRPTHIGGLPDEHNTMVV